MTKEIIHQVEINATPAEVFEALMDSKRHTQFTGVAAKIGRKVGSAFECYDRYITGTTLALEKNRLIVQAWRSRNWPKGTFSVVSFKLSRRAGGKTRLTFAQAGVPAGDHKDKNKGWRTHYWDRLKKYFAEQK